MDKELEAIMRLLKVIKDIAIQNNNLMGFICSRLAPPEPMPEPPPATEEMVQEIFKYHAENEVAGES
jgi:hypothetical protein|tara:strand:- start:544 stop:744 length:201 start_codon:yes stop_codon:yes gene_type:complete